MAATGPRGQAAPNPRDRTGLQAAELRAARQRQTEAADRAANLDAIEQAAYMRGWSRGWDDGQQALLAQLEDLTDDDQADEPGQEEDIND